MLKGFNRLIISQGKQACTTLTMAGLISQAWLNFVYFT